MTAVVRLFVFTFTLVALGSSSACITTLCLSALCGNQQSSVSSAPAPPAPPAAPAARSFEIVRLGVPIDVPIDVPSPLSERSDHNCNLMRF